MNFVSNSTGAFYERAIGQMGSLREVVERLQTEIASGQRIQRGSDDPVGAARLRAIARLEQRGETEEQNAARLQQDITATSDELTGIVSIIQRARELAVAAGSDTLSQEGRDVIADEIDQLGEELFARANGRTITGAPLFSGTAPAPAYIRDANGIVTYAGNNENGAVPVAPGIEIERTVNGPQVFEFEVGGNPTDAFTVLADLSFALRGGVADPAQATLDAIAGLDGAIDSANRSQTVIGTRLAWVETIQQDQQNRAIDLAQNRSDVGDTNLADTIVRLQQTLTALEASQASFTRVSALTLFNAL